MSLRRFFFHHRLGYKANPFGALTAEAWTAVAFIPPAVQHILDVGGGHLQLLGPKGCGKTTTLLKLAKHFASQGQQVRYEYIPEGQTHFTTSLAGLDVFVLDEAQRLRRRERRRWLKGATAVTFIFSSHKDLASSFAHHQALQSVQVDAAISLTHYQTWIDRRLAYFSLPGASPVTLTDEAIAYLCQTFGADMRAAEYFLYEVFQKDWTEAHIGAQALAELRPVL